MEGCSEGDRKINYKKKINESYETLVNVYLYDSSVNIIAMEQKKLIDNWIRSVP